MTKRLLALLLALAFGAPVGALAGTSLWDQSTTAASNTAVGGVSTAEGMAPSQVNDAMRAIVAQTKGALVAPTSAGTDTITLTLTPAIDAYATGMQVYFIAGGTNTGAATLNVNARGAKDLQKVTTSGLAALAAGDIRSGQPVSATYDGTRFVIMSPTAAAQTPPPIDGQYLVLNSNATLTQERVIQAGNGLTGADAGAGSTWTLAVGAGTGITVAADSVAVDKATQADVEANTANKVLTADNFYFGLNLPKFVGSITGLSAGCTVNAVFNTLGSASCTRNAAGDYTLTWTTAVTSPFAQLTAEPESTAAAPRIANIRNGGLGATSARIVVVTDASGAADPASVQIVIYGNI